MGSVIDVRPALAGAAARARAADCRAVLGGSRDLLRAVWDEQATARDRKLLLAMAGVPAARANLLVGRAWGDLLPEVRGAVRAGLCRFGAWAEKAAGVLS